MRMQQPHPRGQPQGQRWRWWSSPRGWREGFLREPRSRRGAPHCQSRGYLSSSPAGEAALTRDRREPRSRPRACHSASAPSSPAPLQNDRLAHHQPIISARSPRLACRPAPPSDPIPRIMGASDHILAPAVLTPAGGLRGDSGRAWSSLPGPAGRCRQGHVHGPRTSNGAGGCMSPAGRGGEQ
jgi:hypothetical protein